MTILLALTSSAPVSAGSGGDSLGDEAPVHALIDWFDRSPRYAPLGADRYLVATQAGIQVWDALRDGLQRAENWPPHSRFLERPWLRLAAGTLLVAESHSDDDTPLPALLWWDAASGRFSAALDLQPAISVEALVRIDEHRSLACLGFNDGKAGEQSPTRFRAAVVDVQEGTPRWGAASLQALQGADIQGPVEGLGTVPGSSGVGRPAAVYFSTSTCRWEIRNPPVEMQDGRGLNFMHQRLPDGRVVLSHAHWYSPSKDRTVDLAGPLLWSESGQRWETLENRAQKEGGVHLFRACGIDDPVVGSPSSHAEFVEFLDPRTLHWRRSQESIPEDALLDGVAPLSTGEALVFLRDAGGRVLKVGPLRQVPAGHLAYPHGFLGEVRLRDGILLSGGGVDDWYPQNRPEILRLTPTPASRPIAPLPKPWGYLSGVELADRSIVLFGGLPPRCLPSSGAEECVRAEPQPSYRYLPQEDRWQEVPELAIPFANGASLDSGLRDYASARRDAVGRRSGGFAFLDGEDERLRKERDWSRLRSVVYEWQPGGGKPKSLGQLQQGRTQATLLELDDGRLAVIGGRAQVDIGKRCIGCAFDADSIGPLEFASSTEVLHEGKWVPGPRAHFPGGMAVRLVNGRVFKLSLNGQWAAEQGYRSEVADARFRRWTKLPPLPLREFSATDVQVAGNRVLLLPALFDRGKNNDKLIVWDDARRKWSVWQKPTSLPILSIIPLDPAHLLIRHTRSFEQVSMPK